MLRRRWHGTITPSVTFSAARIIQKCVFPLGCPTDGVKAPREPEGDWKGLYQDEKLRLLAAARALDQMKHSGVHQGQRDITLVDVLLGSGLRISELLGCDMWQIKKSKQGLKLGW